MITIKISDIISTILILAIIILGGNGAYIVYVTGTTSSPDYIEVLSVISTGVLHIIFIVVIYMILEYLSTLKFTININNLKTNLKIK